MNKDELMAKIVAELNEKVKAGQVLSCAVNDEREVISTWDGTARGSAHKVRRVTFEYLVGE